MDTTVKSNHTNLILNLTTQQKIQWIVSFVLPILILMLPTTPTFSMEMKKFLAITVWGIYMFATELVNTMISSLLMMFMYSAFQVLAINEVMMPWTNTVPWMCLGALVLVVVVQKTPLLERLAYFAVEKVGGSYMGIVMVITTIAIVARLLLQGTMACISVIVIAFGICNALNLGKSKSSAGIMMMSVIAYMDTNFFIYSPDFISVLIKSVSDVSPVTLSYTDYLYHNVIFIIPIYLVAFIIGKVMKPVEKIDGKEYFSKKRIELGKMSIDEKKVLAILLILVLFLFTNQWHKIDMVYGFILAPLIFFFPGMNIANTDDLKKVNYPVLFFIVACLSIGNAATKVGIGGFVADLIVPHIQNTNSITFYFIIFLFAVLMNFLMTPLAEMAAFGGPLTSICTQLGFGLYPMMYSFFQGCQQLLFPYEISLYLVVVGMGLITQKDFMKITCIKFVVEILFLGVFGIGYWKMVGLM